MQSQPASPNTVDAVQPLKAAITAITATMHVARDLLKSNRPIDLGGLDSQVGLICAKALDLPIDIRGAIRTDLASMLQRG